MTKSPITIAAAYVGSIVMADGHLFDADLGPLSDSPKSTQRRRGGKPRLVRANRRQLRMEARSLEELLPDDHRARVLWQATEKLDLSAFYEEIESVESGPGRPAIDPRVLLVLWLYAISEGVGSARRLARLCGEHDAYRWIAGGLEICHRVLSHFRVAHGAKLDRMLTELLASLAHAGVITLRKVAQDGTKVRASAGAASFRGEKSLKKCLRAARKRVARLKDRLDDDDPTTGRGKRAMRERAAKEREKAVEAALAALEEVRESQLRNGKKGEPRASTTDADARRMKMADGGYRPAYNCQLATDVDSRMIIAARVSNSGGDMGQVEPTLDEIEERLGTKPESYLVDGGYAKHATVDKLAARGIKLYAPPPRAPKPRDPTKRQRKTSQHVDDWKERMETDDAKEIYKERAASIETINGDLRSHRGLTHFPVRGIDRATSVLLLTALTYNLLRTLAIAPAVLLPA